MSRFALRLQCLLVMFAVVFMACDDDDPVAADSPCLDEGTACLSLRLTDDAMTYTSSFESTFDETHHILSWDVASQVITGFTPGGRVLITATFNPPVDVRYDHSQHGFVLAAGLVQACSDRGATMTTSLQSTGWTTAVVNAGCQGDCTSGETSFTVSSAFEPLVIGDRLSRVTIDMTVPQTYTTGAGSGEPVLAGDLGLRTVALRAFIDGDNAGDPPAWQGQFEP